MLSKIGQALKNNIHALIDTSSGPLLEWKVDAYLLPSLLFLLEHEQTSLVISAAGSGHLHSKTRQTLLQSFSKITSLFSKETQLLPISELPHDREFLCIKLLQEFPQSAEFAESLLLLQTHTDHTLPGVLKSKSPELSLLYDLTAADQSLCLQQECPHVTQCRYASSLQQAKNAKIILAAHPLLYNWPTSMGISYPSHLIIDESHLIEQIADEELKQQLDFTKLQLCFKVITELLPDLAEESAQAENLFRQYSSQLDQEITSASNYNPIYWNERSLLSSKKLANKKKDSPLSLPLFDFSEQKSADDEEANSYSALIQILESLQDKISQHESKRLLFKKLSHIFKESCHILSQLKQAKDNGDVLLLYKMHAEKGKMIELSPLDLCSANHKQLFSRTQSTIALATGLGSSESGGIDWILGKRLLGPRQTLTSPIIIPSPLTTETAAHSLILLCKECFPISHPEFVPRIIQEVSGKFFSAKKENPIKVLLLFSSRKRYLQARELLLQFASPYYDERSTREIYLFTHTENKSSLILMNEPWNEAAPLPELPFLQLDKTATISVVCDKFPDLSYSLLIKERRNYYEKIYPGKEFQEYFWGERVRKLKVKIERYAEHLSSSSLRFTIVDSRIGQWKGSSLTLVQDMLSPYLLEMAPLSRLI